ncbi:hypothetical protein ACFYPT_40940 [Streptomyces sp. NPDC005529]|uniref:hypothetical protein n=1 Tax=unclassified Streptomyces TaxID=2593676 RepID=UPI0033BCB9E7
MIATVLDTGPLAAAFNAADRRHPECASLLTSLTGRRLLPEFIRSASAFRPVVKRI